MAQDKNKTKASTQQHLDIEDITENLVLLKSQGVTMIMKTTAVNFDILSEAEQDATIYAYAAFLNSLSFPLQILVRSKKADITAYYQHLEESMKNQPNPDLKTQIQKYMEFIKSTVQQKTILDKQFYLIINYSQIPVGFKGFKKKEAQQTKPKAQLIKDAKINLFPRRDHIVKQAARLGLTSTQLTTKELIELFYDIYNPAPTGTQRIILDTASYTAPMVKPAVETPIPAPSTPPGVEPTQPSSDESSTPSQVGLNTQPPQPEITQTEPQTPIDHNLQTPPQAPPAPPSQREALQSLQTASSQAANLINQRQQAQGQQPQTQTSNQPQIKQGANQFKK